MTEQRLPGGRTVGAVRVGDTVRRPVQPWTPAVHALLRHLTDVGFAGAPRVLGIDDAGREILNYLDGETVGDQWPWPPWVRSDSALRQVGAWLRRLHDATQAWEPPADLTWFSGHGWKPGLVVGHHDASPFNAVWSGQELVGFVDWDTAGPSSRELDLAFTALAWVPLHPRQMAARAGFTGPDRRGDRLHLLLDAAGFTGDRAAFGRLVAERARVNAAGIARQAATGDPVYVALQPLIAEFEQAARDVDALPAAFWVRPTPPG